MSLLVLSVLAACSGGDDTATTTTTVTAAPQGAPPPPSTTSTTSGADAADAAEQQRFVDGDRAFLTPPDRPTTRVGNGQDCGSLEDDGWDLIGCERVTTKAGDAAWVHERRANAERVLVYVNDGGHWRLAQRASDDDGSEFDASVRTVDLMGDGARKIVVVFTVPDRDTTDGVSEPVVADVIEPSGGIVVHVVADYPQGRPTVWATPGRGLEVWDCEADCVPTAPYRYRRIAFANGKWSVVEERNDQSLPG